MRVIKVIDLENGVQALVKRGQCEDDVTPILDISFHKDFGDMFLKCAVSPEFETEAARDAEFENPKKFTKEGLQSFCDGLFGSLNLNEF